MSNSAVTNFVTLYKRYQTFIPLIYRVINEYYLEYIKYQIRTITDLIGNSFMIVAERYEDLRKCLVKLPKNYVDYRYQDRSGNNLLMYLATLPLLSETIQIECYEDFLKDEINLPLTIKNTDGNTIFHIIADYDNVILLKILLRTIGTTTNLNQVKISELLSIENFQGQTMYDLLLEKKNFNMITHIIEYMPTKLYKKLTVQLIENFDLIDRMPNTEAIQQIYLGSINYYLSGALKLKENVLYDIKQYQQHLIKINKLLIKCSNNTDFKQNYYLEWLTTCIKLSELELFKTIMNKYLFNEQSSKVTKYLNSPIVTEITSEPLIITAIKSQNLSFVKLILNYNVDLNATDISGKSSFILALESKNLFLIKLLKEYAGNRTEYNSMVSIFDTFIDLLEKHEVYNSLSVTTTLYKIWNTIEYIINMIVHAVTKSDDAN